MGFCECDYWTTDCDMLCEAEGQQWPLRTWQPRTLRFTQPSQSFRAAQVRLLKAAPFTYAQSITYSIAHGIMTTNFKTVFHETTWSRRNLCFLHVWSITTHENCTLLDYCAASSGNFIPTFRDNLSVPFSMVRNQKKPHPQGPRIQFGGGFLTPVDGTDRLSRFVITQNSPVLIYFAAEAWNRS
jgi:hypothetical protein